jgi:hypothetical protein
MHVVSVFALFKFYLLPIGRCLFAVRIMHRRAVEVGAFEIAEWATKLADHAQRVLSMIHRHPTGGRRLYLPQAGEVGSAVSRCLSSIDDYLIMQIGTFVGTERATSAEQLRAALFPSGVKDLTSRPFAEVHVYVQTVLKRAAEIDLVAPIKVLPDLPALLEQLHKLNDEYGLLLQRPPEPTRAQVRAEVAAVREQLGELVAYIIGWYAREQGDKAERDHLLQPVFDQNEAVRKLRRRRRRPSDIDPETGDELPEDPGSDDELPGDELPGDEPGGDELPGDELPGDEPGADDIAASA